MGAVAVHLSRADRPARDAATRMLAAADHRGDRTRVEELGRATVGVCNHADWVTATIARSGDRLAAFCGALDNAGELRADLDGDPDPDGGATTPAAVLLRAWERWGEDAVRRLRGSYAGVLTDGRTVWCFRDHFGEAPLFHHDGRDGFFAASEVKQVLAAAPVAREPDVDHLHAVLFGGVGESTAYRGVRRIPKGVLAAARGEPGLDRRRYWDPADYLEASRLGPEAAVEGTVEALRRAVRRVLTGRDAILLSGGLDSPALAAFASPADGVAEPVDALTAVYPDHPSADERAWTRKVADHLGLPLHPYVARAASLDDVGEWVDVLDGPVDVVSVPESAEAYRHARELGARTVVNGEIAEMLFESRAFLLDHLLSRGRWRGAARRIDQLRASGRSWHGIVGRVVRAIAPGRVLEACRRHAEPQNLGLPSWVDAERVRERGGESPVWRRPPWRRWSAVQTAPFRGPGSGFEADAVCAAVCGVDSRRPFTDVDLWEFVLSLPAEVKFPDRRTKPLLRRAVRGRLPDEIIDRRDKTFFDEYHLDTADYPALRRFLVNPEHRLQGIDYGLLARRLRQEDFGVYELQWARNVARVHAFLELW